MTAALQTVFANTPSNTTLVFPAGKRYRIEGTVHMFRKHDVTIEGTGATIFATTTGDRTRSQLLLRAMDNMVVHGLTVVGAAQHAGMADEAYDPALEAQHAFQLEGVQNFEMNGVTATDVNGDFVTITRDPDSKRWSDGVWIHDSTFARNGRMGISVTAGRNVLIERNHISDTRRSTIDLEPGASSGGAEYIHVDHNWVGPGRLNFVSAGKTASTRTNDVHDVVISNNVLRGHILNVFVATRDGMGQRRANFAVVNNSSDKAVYGVAPLRFTDVDGVTVAGNRQPSKFAAVNTTNCTKVVIAYNLFALTQ